MSTRTQTSTTFYNQTFIHISEWTGKTQNQRTFPRLYFALIRSYNYRATVPLRHYVKQTCLRATVALPWVADRYLHLQGRRNELPSTP